MRAWFIGNEIAECEDGAAKKSSYGKFGSKGRSLEARPPLKGLLTDILMSAAPYRSHRCTGMVSMGPSWGLLRFAEHSAAFRMTSWTFLT